jgi:hypothetical protein
VFPSWEKQLEAEDHFRKAQFAVASIRPADMNDLGLMAAAATIYDKTYLGGDQQALISYGVSLGVFGLLSRA